MDRLKTILGWKHRPHQHRRGSKGPPCCIERVIDESTYDLTVFKVHFGHITLKVYDKGERVLRVEAVVHNVKDLRCGKALEKLSIMLEKLQRMAVDFLNVLQAAHCSFLDEQMLDALPQPSQRGNRRLAGVDLQKPRMRVVTEATLALAPEPGGFTTKEFASKVNDLRANVLPPYTCRQAAYDLSKLRGKAMIERVGKTRRYQCRLDGIRALAGLFVLREKVIRPVLAGVCKTTLGDPPKNTHPLDAHYTILQAEMLRTMQTLALAA